MRTTKTEHVTIICACFVFACAWFGMWGISLYLVKAPEIAVLLFPFGLKIGLMIQCERRHWIYLLITNWLMILLLTKATNLQDWGLLFSGDILSLLPLVLIPGLGYQLNWMTLVRHGGTLLAAAFLQSLPWLMYDVGTVNVNALLVTLTGAFTIAPPCLVIWHYLSGSQWQPLGPGMISQPVTWRIRNLTNYLFFVLFSLSLQLMLPAEFYRFSIFCLAMSSIALAWCFGWQGALIAALMNTIALIAKQGSQDNTTDLLLTLFLQNMAGFLLGTGIHRLRELNHSLRDQLLRNQKLTALLLESEENIRRGVARELHDDIGQTVTAIRMQASIMQCTGPRSESVTKGSYLIEQLSLNVYDSVKRLLERLHPRQLDKGSLESAIHSVINDMRIREKGITSSIDWKIDESLLNQHQRISIFRIFQEGLNNIVKHANAGNIIISCWYFNRNVALIIKDNGQGFGFEHHTAGYGLSGIKDRVKALGGSIFISGGRGVILIINFPIGNGKV